jgi:hypothetical protein
MEKWTADLTTRTGVKVHVRPVRREDEAGLTEFFSHVTKEDLRSSMSIMRRPKTIWPSARTASR